jgi:hypothetical protein
LFSTRILVRALLAAALLPLPGILFAAPSAPPRKCEISLSAWCITEGAQKIERELATDNVHDRVWTLQGWFRPKSQLVIFEPNGCKNAFSDAMEFLGYDENVSWKSRKWDRLRVRLIAKGGCDLDILLTPDDGEPLEWAFSEGIASIRGCSNAECHDVSIASLQDHFKQRFHRKKAKHQ